MGEKLKIIKDVVIKFCKEKKTVAISIGVAIILLLIAIIIFSTLRSSQGNLARKLKKSRYDCCKRFRSILLKNG
jgi:flagellar biosynthesis/type III secretory pathway M-ring protein FliF/YscJ